MAKKKQLTSYGGTLAPAVVTAKKKQLTSYGGTLAPAVVTAKRKQSTSNGGTLAPAVVTAKRKPMPGFSKSASALTGGSGLIVPKPKTGVGVTIKQKTKTVSRPGGETQQKTKTVIKTPTTVARNVSRTNGSFTMSATRSRPNVMQRATGRLKRKK